MTEPMSDERLKELARTGGCDYCDSQWTACIWEITRLRAILDGINRDCSRIDTFALRGAVEN